MRIEFEVHVPGLDMSQSRWTYHVIFCNMVHERTESIAACARDCFERHGRGTLYVSRAQWMEIVRDSVVDEPVAFPCNYIDAGRVLTQFDFGMAEGGVRSAIEQYDPEKELVLTVEHHPKGMLSCYLIDYRSEKDEAEPGRA